MRRKHDRVRVTSAGPTLTRQDQAQGTDLNAMMKRYAGAGSMPEVDAVRRVFVDLSNMPTFFEANLQVIRAREAFDKLDADVRKRFGNSVVDFVKFCADPANERAALEAIGGKPIVDHMARQDAIAEAQRQKAERERSKVDQPELPVTPPPKGEPAQAPPKGS